MLFTRVLGLIAVSLVIAGCGKNYQTPTDGTGAVAGQVSSGNNQCGQSGQSIQLSFREAAQL